MRSDDDDGDDDDEKCVCAMWLDENERNSFAKKIQ